jgi:hypothetical protein
MRKAKGDRSKKVGQVKESKGSSSPKRSQGKMPTQIGMKVRMPGGAKTYHNR